MPPACFIYAPTLVEYPRADKVTTLHLRTSANYCLCMAIIPPWRCRHFVGGSILRFKGPLAKGAVMRSMTGGLAGDQRSPLQMRLRFVGRFDHTPPKIPNPPPQQAALRSKPPDSSPEGRCHRAKRYMKTPWVSKGPQPFGAALLTFAALRK